MIGGSRDERVNGLNQMRLVAEGRMKALLSSEITQSPEDLKWIS